MVAPTSDGTLTPAGSGPGREGGEGSTDTFRFLTALPDSLGWCCQVLSLGPLFHLLGLMDDCEFRRDGRM